MQIVALIFYKTFFGVELSKLKGCILVELRVSFNFLKAHDSKEFSCENSKSRCE